MSNQHRAILLCLSGLDTEEFIGRAAPHLPRAYHIVLLYVIDTRPAEEMGYIARRLHGGPGMAHHQQDIMAAADTQMAETVLNEAEARCAALGFDPSLISRETRKGRPEHEIIQIANRPDPGISLVVIGSAYKRGGHPSVGPASLGHVARFVIDHSPCDVLILR